jgi:hypothetical protein
VTGRFNERLVLSLASCPNCLMMDDELNVLPTSRYGTSMALLFCELSNTAIHASPLSSAVWLSLYIIRATFPCEYHRNPRTFDITLFVMLFTTLLYCAPPCPCAA